jgi:hypothetical protein
VNRPKAPCFKYGNDCTKRKVGCRVDCEEWQLYEKRMTEYREELCRYNKTKGDTATISINRMRKFAKVRRK